MGQVRDFSCGIPSGGLWVELAEKKPCAISKKPLIWQKEERKTQENKAAPV